MSPESPTHWFWSLDFPVILRYPEYDTLKTTEHRSDMYGKGNADNKDNKSKMFGKAFFEDNRLGVTVYAENGI